MTVMRTLPWDWHAGEIPANVDVADDAYVETTFSFHLFRGEREGAVRYAPGAHTYLGTMFDAGPKPIFGSLSYGIRRGQVILSINTPADGTETPAQ